MKKNSLINCKICGKETPQVVQGTDRTRFCDGCRKIYQREYSKLEGADRSEFKYWERKGLCFLAVDSETGKTFANTVWEYNEAEKDLIKLLALYNARISYKIKNNINQKNVLSEQKLTLKDVFSIEDVI